MATDNSFGGRRILVVEDDLLVVADLVDMLHSMGADVVGPIENIEKAPERLDKLPDIAGAVLDVSVQGRMVFPLADELSRRNVPYVFSTGYDDSIVPARYSDIRRFSKPADERQIASILLEAVQNGSPASGPT
ncbi:response regulator (plasmid) [Devosia sp. A8/3-2]|nr:response regulator [Devosia sp. A8/3-2]